MLISYLWLKEYLDIDLPPQKLAEELTLMGLEVTEIKSVNPPIPGLAIGEVLEKKKHPNADRLNLTQIRHLQDGAEVIHQVVCGASNIDAGQKIILARVGTELAPGFVIKKAKIRGEESCGMVCSREELGQEEKSEGIWVLPPETPLDTDPQTILGNPDHLFEFDITSNRWDCMCVLGIAREVKVLLKRKEELTPVGRGSFAAQEPGMSLPDYPSLPPHSRIRVEIQDPQDCYRYQGLDITDIQVGDSPDWLGQRLFHHGLRPIDNVVDVTNLILREYGQPIHAFDADKVGNQVSIRRALPGEEIVLLDGKKISLHPEDLLIADENGPLALAGVMGGLHSAVTSKTKRVFLETAVFSPKRIRQTMTRHQLSTDAGRYFQHRVDPVFSAEVVKIAGAAIAYLGQGKIPCGVVDAFPDRERFLPRQVTLTRNLLDKTLGTSLPAEEITDIFTRLSFTPLQPQGDDFTVTVPSHRQDVEQEWDLIEEVARVYGYNRIPITYPRITNGFGPLFKSPQRKIDEQRERFKRLCLSMGFHEVLTYPFIENGFSQCLKLEEKDFLKPLNPVWNDISLLRNSLLFGFLKTIQHNTDKKVIGFNRIFEINKVFSPLPPPKKSDTPDKADTETDTETHSHRDASPYEHSRLGMAIWEGERIPHWRYSQEKTDYAEMSGAVEQIFTQIPGKDQPLSFQTGNGESRLFKNLEPAFIPGSAVPVRYQGQEVGVIGEISDTVKGYFGLESSLATKRIFYSELDLDSILAPPIPGEFVPFSIYPAIRRDLALVLDQAASVQDILKELPHHSPLLTQVFLSNIYEGENIPAGKKSVVFSLEFISHEKTLQRGDADQEVLKIVDLLKKKYNFVLR